MASVGPASLAGTPDTRAAVHGVTGAAPVAPGPGPVTSSGAPPAQAEDAAFAGAAPPRAAPDYTTGADGAFANHIFVQENGASTIGAFLPPSPQRVTAAYQETADLAQQPAGGDVELPNWPVRLSSGRLLDLTV